MIPARAVRMEVGGFVAWVCSAAALAASTAGPRARLNEGTECRICIRARRDRRCLALFAMKRDDGVMSKDPMPKTAWLATLDARSGRLIRATRTDRGAWHFDEHGSIRNDWEDRHEHSRPTQTSSAHGPVGIQHAAGTKHPGEEELRRFVRDACAWLQAQMRESRIEHLVVAAPARVLGSLRHEAPPALAARITELPGELSHLRVSELAEHPTVLGALGGR